MDLRLGPPSRLRIIPRPEDGLRAVMNQAREKAPQAEAAAAQVIERTRPVWSRLVLEWRRLGTAAAALLIAVVILHTMFGANGMVVYRQKRAEMKALQDDVDRLQKENASYADRIKGLKSDPNAIEKEAREQLHYTRPHEYVYVAPDPPQKPPAGQAKNGP